MSWDDDKKAKAVQMYQDAEPTAENSMEIVKEIAETLEESPNGVRMILTNAGVYVKKAVSAGKSDRTPKEGSNRVGKQAAFEGLTAAIKDLGLEPDMGIIEKMTAKAAVYFTSVLESASKSE